MKTPYTLTSLFAAVALSVSAVGAAEKKAESGPKGGRLLENAPQKTEFFVNADRKVEINVYDAGRKPIAPTAQTVTVIAETKGGRQALAMEKRSAGFVSTNPLPAGDPYRVVVQLRETATSRPQNYRINLELHTCDECKLAEYACICGH